MRDTRVLCLWLADWPVLAVQRAHGVPAAQPLAVMEKGTVLACSASARSTGVRRGLRAREVQARCPEIELYPYAEDLDALQFEPVVAAVESVVPGVEVPRPGVCLLRVTGAARYYRGEQQAATAITEAVAATGVTGARVGIADDAFTAELAARVAQDETAHVVPPGGSAAFLAPIDIGVLDRPRLVTLLRRLGIDTLGELTTLPIAACRDRFGPDGELAHRQASGREHRPLRPRVPPRRFTKAVPVEPPLADADLLVAAAEPVVADLVADLGRSWLACTELTLTLTTEAGRVDRRCWRHPRWFTAHDLLDRLRWQLAEWGESEQVDAGSDLDPDYDLGMHHDAIARIDLKPARVEPAADHDGGLWGGGPEEKVQHVVSGLQSTLGRTAVLTPALVGGRAPAQRQALVAWGERLPASSVPIGPDGRETGRSSGRSSGQPSGRTWPGSLPPPAPATVFGSPLPCRLYGAATDSPTTARQEPLLVTDRGVLTGVPRLLASGRDGAVRGLDLVSWAGPWPVDDRWWEADARSRSTASADGPVARLQVLDAEGVGWLLLQAEGRWYLEARYD